MYFKPEEEEEEQGPVCGALGVTWHNPVKV